VDRTVTTVERTPDGRRFVVARTVAAPAEAAWSLLCDTARWPAWGPSVAAVEADRRHVEAGMAGRVRVLGVWVPFRIDTCDDYRWTWRVAGVPATGHVVRPVDADRCQVGFEVPLAAAAYLPVCRRGLCRIARLLETESDTREGDRRTSNGLND
jgi:hypothetical protein